MSPPDSSTPLAPPPPILPRLRPRRPHPHYAQLATIRPDGLPANRNIVVRSLTPSGQILITTDSRSAKLDHLRHQPLAELCWSLPPTREQFRLLGPITIHPSNLPLALDAWPTLSPPLRQSFTWPTPSHPLAPPSSFHSPTPDLPPPTFTLLLLTPTHVDHLDLRSSPHRRTLHHLQSNVWTTTPVNP